MDDAALELGHAGPVRRVADRMAIVALAHPQEVGGEAEGLAGIGARAVDGPAIVGARPARRDDRVAVADVAREVVLFDHLAHVVPDLLGRRDRRAGPRLEAVAEGEQIAVGADAGIFVGKPGAAEALLRLGHDEAGVRQLLCKMIRAADARDAGAHDQDVEVRRLLVVLRLERGIGHGLLSPQARLLARQRHLSNW